MLPLIAGLAVGLGGAIGKAVGRGKANRQMEKLLKQDPKYVENPIVRQRLGLAQTLLNSRMPGSASVERNIYANQANQLSALNRGATDASQALALASGIGAETNQAFNQLGITEAQDYQRRYGNLVGAQDAMVAEGDKVFNDSVRRYQNLVGIRGAQQENRQNTWGDISNFGFAVANMAASGAFGNGGGGGMDTGRTGNITSGMTGGLQRTSLGNVSSMGVRPTVSPTPTGYRPLTPYMNMQPQIMQYNQPYYTGG